MNLNNKHKPWLLLTMVDLKVVDAQAFEDGHALLQDVQRLAQLRVRCAVHSADLRGKNIRSDTELGREDRRRTGSVPYLDVVVAEESLQLLVLVGGAAAAVGETHQPAMTG